MFSSTDNAQQAKPMPTCRTGGVRPAMRPDRNAPVVMPPMVGMNNHANPPSPSRRCCITNTGAEAMYRKTPPKLTLPASDSRRKRGFRPMRR